MAYIYRIVILFWIDRMRAYVLLIQVCLKQGPYKGLVSKLPANCLAWAGASKFAIAIWSNMSEATFLRSTGVLQHQQVIKL